MDYNITKAVEDIIPSLLTPSSFSKNDNQLALPQLIVTVIGLLGLILLKFSKRITSSKCCLGEIQLKTDDPTVVVVERDE